MAEQTWSQPITKIGANKVAVRGYRIDELMGRVPFAHTVFLVLKGELPTDAEGRVMDAILVSSVDHGATPPSALAARTLKGLVTDGNYLGGSVRAKSTPCCTQPSRSSSSATPWGSTTTQPFMGRPVISKTRATGWARASS